MQPIQYHFVSQLPTLLFTISRLEVCQTSNCFQSPAKRFFALLQMLGFAANHMEEYCHMSEEGHKRSQLAVAVALTDFVQNTKVTKKKFLDFNLCPLQTSSRMKQAEYGENWNFGFFAEVA